MTLISYGYASISIVSVASAVVFVPIAGIAALEAAVHARHANLTFLVMWLIRVIGHFKLPRPRRSPVIDLILLG